MKNLIEEILCTKLSILLLSEKDYSDYLSETIRGLKLKGQKICYVAISRKYKDVVETLSNKGIDTHAMFFIDAVSEKADYNSEKNCVFLESPEIEILQKEIQNAVTQHKCEVIIFDTISSLLIYEPKSSILKFSYDTISKSEYSDVNQVYCIIKDASIKNWDNKNLLNDLEMFAGIKVDLS